MADGGSDNNESWESWLGGWVQTAKEKSNTALEFVKKDLAEFTCTIQKETERAVEKTSSSLTKANTEQATSKVKAGISSFFDNISKALVIPPDDDYVAMKVSSDGTSLYDRGKARLHALQLDASTYIDPPHGSPEQYSMWLDSFDMDEHKGEISEVLVSKVEVRALYTRLVPNEVSHAEFWQRYFYKVHQLQCDEARKQALMRRADQTKGDSLSWEDDWSGGEEEDDGNQSDWEKMPRPPQSSMAERTEKSTSDSPTSPPLESTNSTSSDLRDNQEQVTKPHSSIEKESSTSKGQTDTNSQLNSHPISASPDQAPAEALSEKCLGTSVKSEEVSGSFPSQPAPELWSRQVPSEIACASHPEMEDERAERDDPVQPGSSPDAHHVEVSRMDNDARQKVDAFNGAAAASMEVSTPSNTVQNLTADGACGAADMVESPPPPQLSDIPPSNLDIPAASSSQPSSAPEPPKEPEEVGQDQKVVTTDATDENVASVTVKGHSEDTKEMGVNEDGKAMTSAEESTQSPKSGDEVSSDIGMRIKGDMVVIGERGSPSTDSSDAKDLGLDEDWEKDFDVEVTEDDLKAAEDIAKKLGENLDAEDDDWENWE